MSAAAPHRAFTLAPYSYAEARALADALGLSDPVATTLVRRGYRTVEAAREFLEASESHDPFEFEGMDEVVERLLAAARGGRTITVHGDFDVDGVCATAILVAALRGLGARCDWYIPDRMGDGYGVTHAGVERLAARGTELLVTVDCGITAAEEVATARRAGMEVVVTDHHAPDERLPDAPILHPAVSGYPCPELCATGVAHKLCAALGQSAGPGTPGEADLDLVALATVADLVPLTGENRSLVRRGLAEARRGQRPGLRALCAAAGVDSSRLDEGDLAFRLAPRINAAGRLYRADAGVELLITGDARRVEEIATELDRANRERRDAEREVLAGAEAALGEHPGGAQAPALVLAGEGWHPGVIGIVASRLAERHWRPVVVVALRSGTGRGSGRSIPAFDLVGALRECGEHLLRFGGHRAAAGLEIAPERMDAFREALVACASRLEPRDLTRTEALDAVVSSDRLGLDTAEELQRLGPFGIGNPRVRLLVPAARMSDVRPMGDGRHARFSVQSGAARALGVAFGSTDTSLAALGDSPVDLSVGLEVNRWSGSVEPRVVLRDAYPIPVPPDRGSPEERVTGCPSPATGEEWWRRFRGEHGAALKPWPEAVPPGTEEGKLEPRRRAVEHPGGSGVATLADLVSSGAVVVALCADASRRGALAERADPRRFGGGTPEHLCARCGAEAAGARERLLERSGPGLLVADWGALERVPDLAGGFEHVVLVDPPPFAHLEAAAVRGTGYVHLAWGEVELGFAMRVHEAEWEPRAALRDLYRALREHGGEPRDRELEAILAGPGPHRRSPELAGRCVRVLGELGLVEGADRSLRVVSSKRKQLDESKAYRVYRARYEEGKRFLGSRQRRRERPRARAA